jgi:hypothetical protein
MSLIVNSKRSCCSGSQIELDDVIRSVKSVVGLGLGELMSLLLIQLTTRLLGLLDQSSTSAHDLSNRR